MNSLADFIKNLPRNEADTRHIPCVLIEQLSREEKKSKTTASLHLMKFKGKTPTRAGHCKLKSCFASRFKKSSKTNVLRSELEGMKSPTFKMNLLPLFEKNLIPANECITECGDGSKSTNFGACKDNGDGLATNVRSSPFLGIRTRSKSESGSNVLVNFSNKFDQPEVTFIDGMKFVCHDLRKECHDSDINHLVNQYLNYDSGSEENCPMSTSPKKTDDVRKIKGSANKQRYKEDYEESYGHSAASAFGPKRKELKAYVYGAADYSGDNELMYDPFSLMKGVQLHEIEDAFISLSSQRCAAGQQGYDLHPVTVTEGAALSAVEAIMSSMKNVIVDPPVDKISTFPVISEMDALAAVEAFIKILTPTKCRRRKRIKQSDHEQLCASRSTKTGRITKVPARFRDKDFSVQLPNVSPKDTEVGRAISGNIFAVLKEYKPKVDSSLKAIETASDEIASMLRCSADQSAEMAPENNERGFKLVKIKINRPILYTGKRFIKVSLQNFYNDGKVQQKATLPSANDARKAVVVRDDSSTSSSYCTSSNASNGGNDFTSRDDWLSESIRMQLHDHDYLSNDPVIDIEGFDEEVPMKQMGNEAYFSIGNSNGQIRSEQNKKERVRRADLRNLGENLSDAIGIRSDAFSLQKTLNSAVDSIKKLEHSFQKQATVKQVLKVKNTLLSNKKRKLMQKHEESGPTCRWILHKRKLEEQLLKPVQDHAVSESAAGEYDNSAINSMMDKKKLLSTRLAAQLENLKKQKAALNICSPAFDDPADTITNSNGYLTRTRSNAGTESPPSPVLLRKSPHSSYSRTRSVEYSPKNETSPQAKKELENLKKQKVALNICSPAFGDPADTITNSNGYLTRTRSNAETQSPPSPMLLRRSPHSSYSRTRSAECSPKNETSPRAKKETLTGNRSSSRRNSISSKAATSHSHSGHISDDNEQELSKCFTPRILNFGSITEEEFLKT